MCYGLQKQHFRFSDLAKHLMHAYSAFVFERIRLYRRQKASHNLSVIAEILYTLPRIYKLVSAVADGPRDADQCTLKSYQLLHET